MVQAGAILEGSKLAGGLVDGRIVCRTASRPSEGQVPEVDAAQMSELAVLWQQKRAADLGGHCRGISCPPRLRSPVSRLPLTSTAGGSVLPDAAFGGGVLSWNRTE